MENDQTFMQDLHELGKINKTIHSPARLMILTILYVIDTCDFAFLLKQTSLTSGNLSANIIKLEEAGLISVMKEFVDRKPMTLLEITPEGRENLAKYRQNMQQILDLLQ
ncbi:MAG: transcriptional regulator [Anaerolineaceae bacterium]|nr:transcriptional regulator [Anaerolineaceae bacterium]